MEFLIGLLVGLALGAAIAYFLASKTAVAKSATVQDLQRQLALAESEYERRWRELTEQQRQDGLAHLSISGEASLTPPKAVSAVLPSAESALGETGAPPFTAAPEPQSEAQPEPQPPVSMSPAPPSSAIAQPSVAALSVPAQEPAISNLPPASDDHKTPTRGARITDANAVLAASYSPKAAVRSKVARAIAQSLSAASPQAQARWLPTLGRLSRDPDPSVRLAAVKALSQFKSSQRLPLLQQALKDTDPEIVATANILLNTVKGTSKPDVPAKKHRSPKKT